MQNEFNKQRIITHNKNIEVFKNIVEKTTIEPWYELANDTFGITYDVLSCLPEQLITMPIDTKTVLHTTAYSDGNSTSATLPVSYVLIGGMIYKLIRFFGTQIEGMGEYDLNFTRWQITDYAEGFLRNIDEPERKFTIWRMSQTVNDYFNILRGVYANNKTNQR